MTVWKVTLIDFISQEEIVPFLVETVSDGLQELEQILYTTNLLTGKQRLRLVERVGTVTRQSCARAETLHESTGQGY